MTFDMNDAEPQMNGEIIPDGTFAKVTMAIRPGGVDGQSKIDQCLLKAPKDATSNVLMLDCEFTVVEGPHARRKFWQMFTVQGGKVDENGVSIGWKISKSTFRAMIDSALGLAPDDMSEEAKAKRVLRGLADLNGITFVAKIAVEQSAQYKDKNKLDRVVLPNEKEWQAIMRGEVIAASPSHRAQKPATPAQGGSKPQQQQQRPAWSQAAPPPLNQTRRRSLRGPPGSTAEACAARLRRGREAPMTSGRIMRGRNAQGPLASGSKDRHGSTGRSAA